MGLFSYAKVMWGFSYTCFTVIRALEGKLWKQGPNTPKSCYRTQKVIQSLQFHIFWLLTYTCFKGIRVVGGTGSKCPTLYSASHFRSNLDLLLCQGTQRVDLYLISRYLCVRAFLWDKVQDFVFLLLGCLTANFGPLLRWQPHYSDVNHCVFGTNLTGSSQGVLWQGWIPKLRQALSGVWTGTLLTLSVMP